MFIKVTMSVVCIVLALGVSAVSAITPLPLLGAAKEVSVDDQVATAIAHYAVSTHPGPTIVEGYFDTVDKILATKRQIAGGELYTLHMKVKPSTCVIGNPDDYDSAKCTVSPSAKEADTRICTAMVHIRVWLKPSNTISKWTCN